MSDINWAEPDPIDRSKLRKPIKYVVEAEALRANPGRWALIMQGSPSNVRAIKSGGLKAFPAGEFEATSRINGDTHDIYVRFVGGSK